MTRSQVNVRIPVELKEWLQEQAAANHRSFTQEVVLRLSESQSRVQTSSNAMPASARKVVQQASQ